MNAERLLAHYERIAEAPDAVARLRRFVLDLAVRGKLVPQDAKDEPASELLKRIAKEKARLVKAGEVRKSEVDPTSESEAPFSVPTKWSWTRLGSIADWGSGSTPPRGNVDLYGGGITWLKSGELNDERSLRGSEETVTQLAIQKGSFRFNRPGDVLIAMYGATIGKVALLAEDAVTNQAVCGCTPFAGVFNQFLFLFLLSQREQFRSASEGGAQPNISKVKIIWTLFPLPPLAEQRRIVAKVDELMALCDRLEAARAGREAARDRLAAASLARLNAPDPETFPADVRFALQSLPALTTRPDQIKAFRQTILNLAVRGKLVAQDTKEKAPNLKSSECDGVPAFIPSTWRYTRLVNLLAEDTRNGYSRKPDEAANGIPILRISAGTARADGVVAEEEHKLISGIGPATRSQYGLKSGDLLACRFNGNKAFVGRLTIFEDYLDLNPIYPDKLIRIRALRTLVASNFLRLAGDSNMVRAEIEAACATTVGNWGISASNLKDIWFPLPPLAEQHRIVAKVDQLMALCNRLEANLTAAADTRRRLLDALLAQTLAPAVADEKQAAE